MKVLIIGGGQVGMYLAMMLQKNGDKIKIIENKESQYQILVQFFGEENVFWGSASDPDLLERAGIQYVDVLAAVSDLDEINLVVTTLAKMEYGVSRVVGRVNDPKNAWLYTKDMGIDAMINQADIISKIVMEEMGLHHMLTLMELNRGKFEIVQITVMKNAKSADQRIMDLQIPKDVLLIALTRGETMIIPKGDTVLLEGDDVLAIIRTGQQVNVQKLFG